MSENKLIIFNNENFGEIRTLTINEEPYFVAKDLAAALGYTTLQRMYDHVDKEDKQNIDPQNKQYQGLCENGIILEPNQNIRRLTIINESGLYSAIFGSTLPEAKAFKRWVTSEVLPTIRKTECYIEPTAPTESVDYQTKYGMNRIRRTFNESTDPRETYEEFIELSKAEIKARRVTTEDRIKACKIIIDTLEVKVADNISTMRGSELLAIQELLTDINKDLRVFCNKRNGGLLAAKTKEINQLNSYFPSDDDWYLIEKAPFSENYMYESRKDKKGLVKTPAYSRWINNLNLNQYLPETYPNVDFTKPLNIWIAYGCMDKFDIVNLHKAIIDQISDYYDFDDNLILEFHPILNEYVSSYSESYMFISIRNI